MIALLMLGCDWSLKHGVNNNSLDQIYVWAFKWGNEIVGVFKNMGNIYSIIE